MDATMEPEATTENAPAETSRAPELEKSPSSPKRRRGRPRKPKPSPVEEQATNANTAPPAAPPPAPFPSPSTIPIKATGAIAAVPATVEIERTLMVWLGSSEECCYWTVHAGGQDFPRISQTVHTEDALETRRETHRGKIVDLTKSEIERISIAVGRKVVRKHGARVNILNVHSKHYREMPGDLPLGAFLWMIVLGDNLPHNWRELPPEMMA